MSFAGGHGTLAGLAPVLEKYDADELLEVGLGLATMGLVTGIVVGTMLVNYAGRLAVDLHRPRPADLP
jgi:ESS family glutamate:Na+ symporter